MTIKIGFVLMILGVVLFGLVAIFPTQLPAIDWSGYIISLLIFAVGAWHVIDELMAAAEFHRFDRWVD